MELKEKKKVSGQGKREKQKNRKKSELKVTKVKAEKSCKNFVKTRKMSTKSLLMSPLLDLQLPPTPPMDLSDSNSNSSNDYKVSFRPEESRPEESGKANKAKVREPLLSLPRTSLASQTFGQGAV